MPNSAVYILSAIYCPCFRCEERLDGRMVVTRYLGLLQNYTTFLFYILLRLPLVKEHYHFTYFCVQRKMAYSSQTNKKNKKHELILISIPNPKGGIENGSKKKIMPNSWFFFSVFNLQIRLRILSSNTFFFFFLQPENLRKQANEIVKPTWLLLLHNAFWTLLRMG